MSTFAPTCFQRCLKVLKDNTSYIILLIVKKYKHLELPVKVMAARSGEEVTMFPNVGPSVGTKFTTPSGMPASRRILKTIQLERIAVSDGFHTVTLPMIVGVDPKFPPYCK